MSGVETDLMASLVASLSRSFREVPPAAIPPMLDCLLASTAQSPSSLFSALFEDFPSLIEAVKKDRKLDSGRYTEVASVLGALCHLLKKMNDNREALQLFIWKGFIPLLTMGHDFERELLNEIAESFFDVVAKTSSWEALEASLVPFFLCSLRLSAGLSNKEELDALEWGEKANIMNMDRDYAISLFGAFPLALSCHVLSLTLNAALRSLQAAPATGSFNGSFHAEKCAANLLYSLCNMTKQLLLQNLENRSCATGFLLPVIFEAFIPNCYFKISIHWNGQVFSRNSFFKEIWTCCKELFSLGSIERRDAYNVLSMFISFLSCTEIPEKDDLDDRGEFDIRTEKQFWDEVKRGLVNEEGLVRKQSIHILKRVLCIGDGSQSNSLVTEDKLQREHSVPNGMTKRELWAEKEAKSLGVGKLYRVADSGFNSQQQWEAFILLYEMLDEYGTHLVEAAWNHQITLLLQFSLSRDNFVSSIRGASPHTQLETFGEVFTWLSILWERGFCHDNPQVRCMIMQSFLSIEWKKFGACSKSIPESFVLGPFLKALDDPVHHTDFGIKGAYSSKTIESAALFSLYYASYLDARRWMSFLINLASLAKKQSFGRVGLMSLADCIASATCSRNDNDYFTKRSDDASLDKASQKFPGDDRIELLDLLRFVIQNSKQHFNPNYRIRVCRKVLEAASSLIYAADVPLEILLNFISEFPREFTDYGGPLQIIVQDWLLGNKKHHAADYYVIDNQLLKDLHDFPVKFVSYQDLVEIFDDEDLEAWELQAKRWARVLFLAIKKKDDLMPTLMFIRHHGVNICKQNIHVEWLPLKFNILTSCLVQEILVILECSAKYSFKRKSNAGLPEAVGQSSVVEASSIYELFADSFLFILNEIVSFTSLSSSVFWSNSAMENTVLPGSVRGRLGGPSQRRLSQNLTTTVLQAVTSMKAVASILSLCVQCRSGQFLSSSSNFLWEFFWKTTASPTCELETEAEFRIAAYESLAHVLKALVPSFSAQDLVLIKEIYASRQLPIEDSALLDTLIISFLQNINNLLTVGVMARSRRAVLLKWKWLCIESLLSIPSNAFENGVHLEDGSCFFSDVSVRSILVDIVESLENAGEDSALPMLRSVRLALELLFSGRLSSAVSSCSGVGKLDTQLIWKLVHYSWILHVSCNKRRVAPIAALLSSVLHSSLFSDENMHVLNGEPGPLKWFVEKIIQEGTKSPRTIRLAALHLTGLWFSYPTTIKYYLEELKQLTLYGSVAFDEDFEGELAENHDVRTELSLLAKSPDPELTEAFINTELYARVSVAALFYKLTHLVDEKESSNGDEESQAALQAGKSFLLELLDSVINEKDLSKELYKKYSAIHRRKVRAWQMICVLSRFVRDDVIVEVTCRLHVALSKNNMPSVRQYIETFAINLYLKFPALVVEQLVPMLRDYDMRAQALSSYVFIAANVILHASKVDQVSHLDELLPPIIPLLTSHHHSLRGFTQVLVYQVLHKLFPPWDSSSSEIMPLEKRCFEDLKLYLEKNLDCARLRASMEGYLDAFDPNTSATPAGIFVSRVDEKIEFECVPTSLMEQVLNFLNDVRDDLRSSMAKDVVTIKNESLNIGDSNSTEILSNGDKGKLPGLSKDANLDFQKKIILAKHENQDTGAYSGNRETYKRLLDMEKEDDLLNQLLNSRSSTMESITGNRQDFILVASLIDRIPNLAGLARTCEVFKASGLTLADTKVVKDKQFQLISVTAEKWVPIIEVPVNSVKHFLEKKKREGYSILGLEQTANSISLDQFIYPKKTVLVLGREKEGIPVDIIHILDACIEIPQLGIVRSLNVHVSGAIALWEYTRQQRSQ